MHERQKLMAMLRKYDFVLYELQLYLDTHPSCPHALRKCQVVSALRQVRSDYGVPPGREVDATVVAADGVPPHVYAQEAGLIGAAYLARG